MKYTERKTLRHCGAVDQEPDEDVEGILLVGDIEISLSSSEHNRCGHNCRYIYPAVYNEKRAWLLVHDWQPAQGYCARGIYDVIISFEEGVKLLIENGNFEFPFLDEEKI